MEIMKKRSRKQSKYNRARVIVLAIICVLGIKLTTAHGETQDTVFLLDYSGSVGSQRELQRMGVKAWVSSSPIDGSVAVAVKVFGGTGVPLTVLDSQATVNSVLSQIDALDGSASNPTSALQWALDLLTSPAANGTYRNVIMSTDAQSGESDPRPSINVANNVRSAGVTICTAGIGGAAYYESYLRQYANTTDANPHHPAQPVGLYAYVTNATEFLTLAGNCLCATGGDDNDEDGVGDLCDNCAPDIHCPDDHAACYNPDQADEDDDDVGDACDNCAPDERCPDDTEVCHNPDQTDDDDDDVGDACDNCDPALHCPEDAEACSNPDQADTDDDGIGDECDNCPDKPNEGQEDWDDDDEGDVCDCDDGKDPSGNPVGDPDNDGLDNEPDCDNCPDYPNPDQADKDSDGVGDVCDNCPDFANADQQDTDSDGVGDACEGTAQAGMEPASKETPPATPGGDPCEPAGDSDGESKGEEPEIDPVYLATGEFYLTETDLEIPGRGFNFIWARKYRSRVEVEPRDGVESAMGNGWDFSYNIWLSTDALGHMFVHDGNTRTDTYTLIGTNPSRYGMDGSFRVITHEADDSYTLTFPDNGKWTFAPIDSPSDISPITKIIDHNNNEMRFTYATGTDRLVEIRDTLCVDGIRERVITIEYTDIDGVPRITSVTDWAGRPVVYEYYTDADNGVGGSSGDLKSVRTPVVTGTPNGNDFPAGKTTVYTYSTGHEREELNHNLLTIKDPKNQVYLVNTYAVTTKPNDIHFDRIMRQQWGDTGDIIDMQYVPQTPGPENNQACVKAIVNDRVGNVREYFYDTDNNGVMEVHYTGRAPDPDMPTDETQNRPATKLRTGDPDSFVTRYNYNEDTLLTRVVRPKGNVTEYVYELELNPTVEQAMRGNLREIHHLPDETTPRDDPTDIVEEFTYYGASGCCFNLLETYTDGKDNVTTYHYDAAGNLDHVSYPITGIEESFGYNGFGQRTSHTWPDNGRGHQRLDEFRYYDDPADGQYGYLKEIVVDSGEETLKLTTRFEYDAVGNVTKVTTPADGVTDYVVNQLNQVVRRYVRDVETETGTVDYQMDLYYDANDNLIKVEVVDHDEEGNVRAGGPITILYDHETLNHVTRVTVQNVDADGDVVTEYDYDANRNQTLVRKGEAVAGRDPTNIVQAVYDERNLLFQVVRAAGHPTDATTTQYDYDLNANVWKIIDGVGVDPQTTTMTHDGYDRLETITDAMGNLTTLGYDNASNLEHIRIDGELTDVAGNANNVRLYEETRLYDEMNRLKTTQVAYFDPVTQQNIGDGVAQTGVTYTPNSQIQTITDDNSNVTSLTYDTVNRLRTVMDAKGNYVAYGYDDNSNVRITLSLHKSDLNSPAGDKVFTTTREHDVLNRVRSVTGVNTGDRTQYRFDARNTLVKRTDLLGNVTRYTYDRLGRLRQTLRELTDTGDGTGQLIDAITTSQSWDDSSRLTSRTDDAGNTTSYEYDSLDRITDLTYADGTTHTFGYDCHDNRTTATDPNGTTLNAETGYDALDRLVQLTITAGAGVAIEAAPKSYAYDGRSRLVAAADAASAIAWTYDSLGMRSETLTIQNVFGSPVVGTTSSTYDGAGNRLTLDYPGGRSLSFVPDVLNRIRTIADSVSGLLATYDYLGTGRVERRTFGANGPYTADGYDVPGRVNSVQNRRPDGSAIVDFTAVWDPVGNKIGRTRIGDAAARSQTFTYDSIYRMVTSDAEPLGGANKVSYHYDGVGNRSRVLGGTSGAGVYALDTGAPAFDAEMNQYSASRSAVLTHDANGNRTAIQPRLPADLDHSGAVDAADLAIWQGCKTGPNVPLEAAAPDFDECTATDLDADNDVDLGDFALMQPYLIGGFAAPAATSYTYNHRNQLVGATLPTGERHEYRYDVLGRRVGKIVDVGGPAEHAVVYFYDGSRVIEERGESGTEATYVFGLYVDEVLSMRRAIGGSTPDFYFFTDDQYSVTAVTAPDGDVVERYKYDDFGALTILAPDGQPRTASAIGNPYTYTGRRYDAELGLYYYRTRHLDPSTGRFTSRDSIGLWGDPLNLGNAYTYVGNNPWTFADPYGLGFWSTVGSGIKGFAGSAFRMVDEGKNAVAYATFHPVDAVTGAASGIYGQAKGSYAEFRDNYRLMRSNCTSGVESALVGTLSVIEYNTGLLEIYDAPTTDQAASVFGDKLLKGTVTFIAAERTLESAASRVSGCKPKPGGGGTGPKGKPGAGGGSAGAGDAGGTAPKRPGSKGLPDHQKKVGELGDRARAEARPGEQVLQERRVQGHESRRIPDQQIVDESGKTRKVFEAERYPSRSRHRNRLGEYDDLGIEHETHGLD